MAMSPYPCVGAAALEGIGIIMPPAPLIASDLETGLFVRLLPDYRAPILPAHVLTLPDASTVLKVRRFIDILVEHL